MKKNTIILLLGTIFSKFFGIARELLLSQYYGDSIYADAYIISSNIPNVIFGFVAAGLVTTFIPIYSKMLAKQTEEEANTYLSNVLNILMVVSLVLAIFGFVFSDALVKVFASGFDAQTIEIASRFVQISIFSVLFLSTKSILEGFLQVKKQFMVTVLGGFIMNTIVISTIFASSVANKPIMMAYGVLVSIIAQTILVIYVSINNKYHHKFGINIHDENLKHMLQMAAPIIFGSSVAQINRVIDTRIASSIAKGGIASLNYAVRISDSILGIFVGSISAVLYPSLAEQAANDQMDALKVTVRKTLTTINILIIPAAAGLMVLSGPVVQLLYGGGKLSAEGLIRTTDALFFYTIGTIAFGMRQILVRTFYAMHDSITPVSSGVIEVVINITLNIILSKYLGIGGLALATSLSAMVSVVVLYAALRKKIGSMNTKQFLIDNAKISVAALVMGVVVFLVYNTIGGNLGMFASIPAGAIAYLILMLMMHVPELDDLLNIVKKKFNR